MQSSCFFTARDIKNENIFYFSVLIPWLIFCWTHESSNPPLSNLYYDFVKISLNWTSVLLLTLFIFIYIQGALEMRNKTVKDKYTPLDKVFMLKYDDQLDDAIMKKVFEIIEMFTPHKIYFSSNAKQIARAFLTSAG